MGKIYLYLTLIIVLISCGPKMPGNSASAINDLKTYSKTIDNNKNLNKEVTEGALTDPEGFKDIGKFKYTVFFNDKNELLKIENIETTNKTVKETYYFKNNKLAYFEASSENAEKKIYLYNAKVFSSENITPEELKVFTAKPKRFQKVFNESH